MQCVRVKGKASTVVFGASNRRKVLEEEDSPAKESLDDKTVC